MWGLYKSFNIEIVSILGAITLPGLISNLRFKKNAISFGCLILFYQFRTDQIINNEQCIYCASLAPRYEFYISYLTKVNYSSLTIL